MKNIVKIILCVAAISLSGINFTQAQEKQDTSTIGTDIKNAADTVADETSKFVAKGVAELTDKTYKDKVGPDGQTIYIDKHAKYYYIDENGNKIYVTKTQLKDNPDQ